MSYVCLLISYETRDALDLALAKHKMEYHITLAHSKIKLEEPKDLLVKSEMLAWLENNAHKPLEVKVEGLELFGTMWVLKLDYSPFINNMRRYALRDFKNANLEVSTNFEYNPHLSVADTKQLILDGPLPKTVLIRDVEWRVS